MKWTRECVAELLGDIVFFDDGEQQWEIGLRECVSLNDRLDLIAYKLNEMESK